jgi:hypothetical protein
MRRRKQPAKDGPRQREEWARPQGVGLGLDEHDALDVVVKARSWGEADPHRNVHGGGARQPQVNGAAYHESGHAVVALFLHRRLKVVSLTGQQDAYRHVLAYRGPLTEERLEVASHAGPGLASMDNRSRNWIEREVMISLAGPLVELRAADGQRPMETGGEVVLIPPAVNERFSPRMGSGIQGTGPSGGDHAFVSDLLRGVTNGDEALARAWEDFLSHRTDHLICSPLIWPRIEAVALALEERGTLRGSEVRAIAFPPLPAAADVWSG